MGHESLLPVQNNPPNTFFSERNTSVPHPPIPLKYTFDIVLLPPQRISSSLFPASFLTKTLDACLPSNLCFMSLSTRSS